VLRKQLGPKGKEVRGDWRKLLSEQLHNLYSSPHILYMIISWGMGQVENMLSMGERRDACSVLWGNLKKRDHLDNLCIHGQIILN
jgi:hypothetical protein